MLPRNTPSKLLYTSLLTAALASNSASASLDFGFDSIRLAYGPNINQDLKFMEFRAAARFQIADFSKPDSDWQHRLVVDTVYARWDSYYKSSDTLSPEGTENFYGLFLTPIWRMENNNSSLSPYFELGAGPGRISDTKIRRIDRTTPLDKASNFQFEVIVGAGIRLGEQKQYEIGVHWSHYSNGYTTSPNYTFDNLQMTLSYRF